LIRQSIEQQLIHQPGVETRNRKPLQRPASIGADWELRCGPNNRFATLALFPTWVYSVRGSSPHTTNFAAKDLTLAHAPPIPLVDNTILVQEGSAMALAVGSAAWYAWLADATSFAFRSDQGTFTAHKERRGSAREYWKAYRRHAGRLHRVYLGKSSELTLDRLNAAAAELARGISIQAPSPHATSEDTAHDRTNVTADTVNEDARPGAQLHESRLPDAASIPQISSSALTTDNARHLHLLSTKYALPASRANLVPRPRLAELLDTAMSQNRKLILIAAPAGSGKTTLLVEWLTARTEKRGLRTEEIDSALSPQPSVLTTRVAWLSLDDADNQLAQFLAYLIAALETVRPGIGAEAWALLRAQVAHPPAQAILTTLVNALGDSPDHLALGLDDYHTITLPAIHEVVAFLLERMPPHMHILMTTRADPPLPLARLRVRGQLAEIRAADLRFTSDETAYLFNQIHGVDLPSDAATQLETRTEGWAAGLQLAALSLHQQDAAQVPAFLADFTGSHAYVFDYLADEVFQHQADQVQSFLLQTAILGRLCGPLCAAVTGQEDAPMLLERLDRANLFLIRLETRRHWYRYHHLFQDFLRERLERAVGATGCALLHRRASVWFEQQGLVGEAIDHALSAQAWGDAIRCLTPLMASERLYEHFLDWPHWLTALPDAVLRDDPELCVRLAWILLFTGHGEEVDRLFDLAEAVWQAAGDQPKVGEVLGWRAAAFYWRRDHLRAMSLAQQALARLPAEAVEQRAITTVILEISHLDLGHVASAMDPLVMAHEALQHSREPFYALAAANGLARAYQLQGQLQRAARLYLDLIQHAAGAMHREQPAAYFFLGRIYYEWNDLASAERALHEGIAVGQRTGRGRYWPSAYAALAWVRWACGDVTQTSFLVEQALALAQQLDSPPAIAETETRQAGLWLAQGDLAAAGRWLARRAIDADDQVPYERQAEYLVLARIRIAQEQQAPGSVDMDAIIHLLDRLLQAAGADGRMSDRIAILGLRALAHAEGRDPNQALASLAAALELAEPEGYIRTFVDEGAPMRALLLTQREQLPESEAGTRLRTYIDRLLGAVWPAVSAALSSSPPPALLSERERTVLQLLAGGHSVQEIATHLVISAHTARTHVKNIYAKLDAHNRVQAIERARTLNLL
jgi:LuxR family maltose regulon positive regulatory protein